MTSITTDSRENPPAHGDIGDQTRRTALLAGALEGVANLMAACRTKAVLATMSERDLDDLGLLPWEVRSEDWAKESATATRCLAA
jgi:uncharacterized protein YjiS (DUF1127 family)